MSFEKGIFWVFAVILIYAAARVITIRNPVHAALHLVLAFFASAALWMLMEAEFLAIALVLVYVGAVMVLFLFVVMMLDVNVAAMRAGFIRFLPVGLIVLKAGVERSHDDIVADVVQLVRERIGPVVAFKKAAVVPRLPKTRSGKILRSTMRKIADGEDYTLPATIEDPAALDEIRESLAGIGYA